MWRNVEGTIKGHIKFERLEITRISEFTDEPQGPLKNLRTRSTLIMLANAHCEVGEAGLPLHQARWRSSRIQIRIEWKRHDATKKFIVKPLCEVTKDLATERGLTDGGTTLGVGPLTRLKRIPLTSDICRES
jgi:hypothetical protein